MMKFEKKHEDWIYDEFKTQSGIGIKEIRYGIEPGRRAAIVRLEDGREWREENEGEYSCDEFDELFEGA